MSLHNTKYEYNYDKWIKLKVQKFKKGNTREIMQG